MCCTSCDVSGLLSFGVHDKTGSCIPKLMWAHEVAQRMPTMAHMAALMCMLHKIFS